MKLARWLIPTVVAGALCVVAFVCSGMDYSPRLNAIEPSLRPFTPHAEVERIATERGIPLTPGEPAERPEEWSNFVVPLDGTMRGKTLHLRFRTGHGLWSAVVKDRHGEWERQFFCIKW